MSIKYTDLKAFIQKNYRESDDLEGAAEAYLRAIRVSDEQLAIFKENNVNLWEIATSKSEVIGRFSLSLETQHFVDWRAVSYAESEKEKERIDPLPGNQKDIIHNWVPLPTVKNGVIRDTNRTDNNEEDFKKAIHKTAVNELLSQGYTIEEVNMIGANHQDLWQYIKNEKIISELRTKGFSEDKINKLLKEYPNLEEFMNIRDVIQESVDDFREGFLMKEEQEKQNQDYMLTEDDFLEDIEVDASDLLEPDFDLDVNVEERSETLDFSNLDEETEEIPTINVDESFGID